MLLISCLCLIVDIAIMIYLSKIANKSKLNSSVKLKLYCLVFMILLIIAIVTLLVAMKQNMI
jgi:hypothetical protein